VWQDKAKESKLEYDIKVYNAKKALGQEDATKPAAEEKQSKRRICVESK